MCRVCFKRPAIPDERHGRCEACVKNGRIAFRFRVSPDRTATGLVIRAGELSPKALHKWHPQIAAYAGKPGAKKELGLHDVEMLVSKDRLESIRVAPDLAEKTDLVLAALKSATERSDAAW